MKQSLTITPIHGWVALDLKEIWRFRGLFYYLCLRDIKVRYKQTLLGASWAVLQPLLTTIVFSVVLGKMAKIPSDGLAYPIFAYCALVPWTFFASCIGRGSQSIVGNAHLISKIYFPRLIIPTATLGPALVDFAISLVVLFVFATYYAMPPGLTAFIAVSLLTLLLALLSLAVGLWFGALNTYYRDVSHIVPFVAQLWMFASPVVYSFNLVPEKFRLIASFNPLVGIIEGYRSAILGRPWLMEPLGISVLVTAVLLVTGLFVFKRLETDFADIA